MITLLLFEFEYYRNLIEIIISIFNFIYKVMYA